MQLIIIFMIISLTACGKSGSGIKLNLKPLQTLMVTTAIVKLQTESKNDFVSFSHDNEPAIIIEEASNDTLMRFGPGVLGIAKMGSNPCQIYIASRTFEQNQDWVNSVIWHEIGHCVGMEHSKDSNDIMYSFAAPLSWYKPQILQNFFRRLYEKTH